MADGEFPPIFQVILIDIFPSKCIQYLHVTS